MIKVLMIGDVVSQAGCLFLRARLPELKRKMQIDIVIANGENAAVGNGILPHSANHLLDSGVDVITTGNHVYKRREIYSYLDENEQILRPANFPSSCPGKGYYLYDGGSYRVLIVNLLGTSFMEPLENPFVTIDRILKENPADYTLVDFHAEATGEKKAMGYYLDGRVSGVVGTHTHVQTADEQILPNGTGFITDLGMTGPIRSVLGVKPEAVIARLKTHLPTRFEIEEDSACEMDGLLLTLKDESGLCAEVQRLRIR